MRSIIVDKKHDGKLLSQFLFDSFSGLTTNTFFKTLRKKDIRINDVKVSKDVTIYLNDEIKIYVVDDLLYKSFSPEIIYEDEHILIANKPVGIEVVGENSFTSLLKDYLKIKSNDSSDIFFKPCHRLDRNTTGLVLFAKDAESLDILLEKFKNHEIEKHYLAKVYGIPKVSKNTLNSYLFKDNKKSLVYISDEPQKGYVKICTSYSVLKKDIKNNYSILDVTLHTGKTHQIRAHLAHIGHPILGDGKYGINQVNKKFGYKSQQLCSYILKFNFSTDAGILNYLNGQKFVLESNSIC